MKYGVLADPPGKERLDLPYEERCLTIQGVCSARLRRRPIPERVAGSCDEGEEYLVQFNRGDKMLTERLGDLTPSLPDRRSNLFR